MPTPIKYTVIVKSSNPDIYGNAYHAALIVNNLTGTSMTCLIDHKSNLESALYEIARAENMTVITSQQWYPIRQFNRMTKNWLYIGCTNSDQIPHILKTIG